MLGVLQPLRQFTLIAQDRQQFLRRPLRLLDQQVREDLARHHHEKRIGARIVFEQRRRQPLGFRLVLHFVTRRPVRHSGVQRIQDHVAGPRLVKLRRVFERRIVHDRGFSALFHLHEDLPDQRRFACARVADHEEVRAFPLARHAHHLALALQHELDQRAPPLFGDEADAIRLLSAIELRRWRSRGIANAKPTTSTPAPIFHVAAHSSSHGDCPP